MKKAILLSFIMLMMVACGGLGKIFTGGTVVQKEYQVSVPFNYDYNFAIIKVHINGKVYNFLVDTGAPTVISDKIYKDLNIKAADRTMVTDSQGQRKSQEVVIIPMMTVGGLNYEDIGAVVANLRDVFEFNCMGIDGILGANQMAKSYWKFDYETKNITITDQLSNYDLSQYTDTLSFSTSTQLTPYITGYANGIQTVFTYDTGSAGHIDVIRTKDDFNDAPGFNRYGSSSVGLYGAIDSTTIRTIKLDSLRLGNLSLGEQLVDLDDGSLIGNDFMNKHEVVMDWKSKSIYLKKLKPYESAVDSTYGFNPKIKENQVLVSTLYKEVETPLLLNDQILRLNDQDYSNITDENVCEIFHSFYTPLKGDSIQVVYKRNDSIKEIRLPKVALMK
ncbi:aspartyl protease family protein [Nonlabens sp.]|uniref:aspartyl protease family protein n=1 Tax=Nonlabens sp. TaxID=1888209 RepID=UPI003F698434